MKKIDRQAKNPSASKKLKRGELKQALIDRALEVGREGRLEEYTMRDFATDLGVSPGAAYRHFESRGYLLLAAANVLFDDLRKITERKFPKNTDDFTVIQLVDMFCSAVVRINEYISKHKNLWGYYFSSSTEVELPAENIFDFKALNRALTVLKERNAIDDLPTPADWLMFSLCTDSIILKRNFEKLHLHIKAFGLDKYIRRQFGVTDKFNQTQVNEIVYELTLAYLKTMGYRHSKWLEIDGEEEFLKLRKACCERT